MRRFMRGCVVTIAAFGVSVLGVGCAQSNESTANLKGQAPTNAPKTQAEMYEQMKGGGAGLGAQGYPGAPKKAP